MIETAAWIVGWLACAACSYPLIKRTYPSNAPWTVGARRFTITVSLALAPLTVLLGLSLFAFEYFCSGNEEEAGWALFLALLVPSLAAAGPELAVVVLRSHGASGTVIATGPGKTLILSCAHAFEGYLKVRDQRTGRVYDDHSRPMLTEPIVIDAPAPTTGPVKSVGVKLLKRDMLADLSLIQLNAGPLPYVTPVAPAGWQPVNCVSVGYDGPRRGQSGTQQFTLRPVHILGRRTHTDGSTRTLTREPPWHGRSGGGLLDTRGFLVGVVSAYEHPVSGPGIYATHEDILSFLGTAAAVKQNAPAAPQVLEHRYQNQLMIGVCPPGQR